ncbi:MAG TPA: response regulator [Prolixibacteraceae bacterium]|jgi:DNA-binding NarL/FixJ family response regulator|nr:response regulator [Prolixibacteraceae bacterium]
MKILIADDSVLILERLSEMLSFHSQAEVVGSYNNGTEALQALRTHQPDLAILDINMPGLNGLEVLSTFRKENKTIKFIILTFHSSEYYHQLAIQAGADHFFNKIDFEELSPVIDELLAKKETHKTNNLTDIIQQYR